MDKTEQKPTKLDKPCPIKLFFRRLLGIIPRPLPQTSFAEYKAFVENILTTYGIPQNDSFRAAISFMIQQLPPTQTRVAPRALAIAIHKARANELAYGLIQEIRESEKKRAKEQADAASKTAAEENTGADPLQPTPKA